MGKQYFFFAENSREFFFSDMSQVVIALQHEMNLYELFICYCYLCTGIRHLLSVSDRGELAYWQTYCVYYFVYILIYMILVQMNPGQTESLILICFTELFEIVSK